MTMRIAAYLGRSLAVAAMAAGASAPAFAAGDELKLTYDAKSDRYCYNAKTTGSRINRDVCLTREELADAGVKVPPRPADPAKLAKK